MPADIKALKAAHRVIFERIDERGGGGVTPADVEAAIASYEAARETGWRPIDTAPRDGMFVNVVGRYPEATAGFPRYAAWREDLGGGWFEHSRFEPQRIIPWVWRPRDDWPRAPLPEQEPRP